MMKKNLIDWRDEFKIGIEEIDFEHQELIDLINQCFNEALQKDSSMSVMYFLGEIFAKTTAHFESEERMMKELKYDQYQDHKDDHERLLDDVRDIMDEFRETTILNQKEFGDRLNHWFAEHFKTRDARLHKFLHQKDLISKGE